MEEHRQHPTQVWNWGYTSSGGTLTRGGTCRHLEGGYTYQGGYAPPPWRGVREVRRYT